MPTYQFLYVNKPTLEHNELVFNFPRLTNDRVPHMELELIEGLVNVDVNTFQLGFVAKLMNAISTNYVSSDNRGSIIGMFEFKSAIGGEESYVLRAPSHNVYHILPTGINQFRIRLELSSGSTIDKQTVVDAGFLFRIKYPEPNEITNTYSREIAKIRKQSEFLL